MVKYFLFIFCLTAVLFAQNQNSGLSITHISLNDGLSQSTITHIMQDSKGFMWFGTANGLNKYDGYSFTVFKSDMRNRNSISNDIINYVYQDKRGDIWAATEQGINLYNPEDDSFKRYLTSSAETGRIMPLIEDTQNRFWAGGFGGGLININRNDGSFKVYKNDPAVNDNSKDYIWCASEDNKGNILLGTFGGLVKFNPSSEKFTNYPTSVNSDDGTSGARVFSILSSGEKNWIGNESGILDCYNSVTNKFTHYPLSFNGQNINGRVFSIIQFSPGRLMLGMMGAGIIIFNELSGIVESHINNLTDNQVYSLLKDKTGIIWAGTYISGLNKIDFTAKKFNLFRFTKSSSGNSPYINCLFKDKNNTKWLGTPAGLHKYNNSEDTYTLYPIVGGVFSIIDAGENNLWVGSSSGLYKFNVSTGKFSSFNEKAGLKSPVRVLYKIGENLLICTRGEGIKIFNPEKSEQVIIDGYASEELLNMVITDIKSDEAGGLWVSGNKGVIKIHADGKKKFFRHDPSDNNSLSSNNALSLCVDKNGDMWIGTYGGGLNKIDKTDRVTWFSEPEGLPNNVIYGVLTDKKDNLWLSTNKGICRFNIKDYSVRNYDLSDGLQGLEFNGGAFSISYDGEMLFGGLDGWNSFYPDKIRDNPNPPSVIITSAKMMNKKLPLHHSEPAGLAYSENFISFDFVSLDYHNSEKNKYAYMLEGFDNDWIHSDVRKYASYTNLEPGEYVFRVKGSNNDEVWNNEGASFSFIISPPFWRTWWFYALSFIFIITVITGVHRYRVRLKLMQIQKIEEVRKRIADDFHDELGHKLTKISLYSEIMKRELTGSLNGYEQYLEKINIAANDLYDDTKDFIWSIDPVKDSLFDLAVYLKDFGDEFFDKTGVSFIVNEIPERFKSLTLPMNWKRQLILIFKEAMNNILKHSGSSEVTLLVEENNSIIKIKLKDNGKGFREDDGKKSGRGLDIMKSRAGKIGGQLEILSLADNGIEMTFTGDINKKPEKKVK